MNDEEMEHAMRLKLLRQNNIPSNGLLPLPSNKEHGMLANLHGIGFKPGVSGNPHGRPKGLRPKFENDTKRAMRTMISRAMRGINGDLEERLFEDMTLPQRWAVIGQWMKIVLATTVENKLEGALKIEVSYEDKTKDKSIE